MLQVAHISDLHLLHWSSSSHLGRFLAHATAAFPPLAHYYTVATPRLRKSLPLDLSGLLDDEPAVLVLSGDIAAWPSDSTTTIDTAYYPYVESLLFSLPHNSVLLPVLGNHDWDNAAPFSLLPVVPLAPITNFRQTRFDTVYDILQPRIAVVKHDGLIAVFFLIDSNIICVPAQGEISPSTMTWLQRCFVDAQNGSIPDLTKDEYEQAIRILILHHSTLPHSAYAGTLSANVYNQLELRNALSLLKVCCQHIDVLLFGHTHYPTTRAFDGFVMINAGPTLSLGYPRSCFVPNFHLIRIQDRNTVELETFYWVGASFSSLGSKPLSFTRGSAPPVVQGYGRWA